MSLLISINSKAVILSFNLYRMSNKSFYYLCLVLGVFLVLIQEFRDVPDLFTQIAGLFLLMFALYNITKGIGDRPQNDSFIENDEEE